MHASPTPPTKPLKPGRAFSLGAACWLLTAALQPAAAQSFCASDGQRRPVALLERFISADCETCWADKATRKNSAQQVVLDWVVPGSKGEDAPLAAVATRDALARLDALHQAADFQSWNHQARVTGQSGVLRVSHGLPFAGYLGTSIELKPAPRSAAGKKWTGWLALVETLPAGTEGSPVERNLVRNVLQTDWSVRQSSAKSASKGNAKDASRFFEGRSMSLAEGVQPARVSLIGWVEDANGRVVNAAQTHCQ